MAEDNIQQQNSEELYRKLPRFLAKPFRVLMHERSVGRRFQVLGIQLCNESEEW